MIVSIIIDIVIIIKDIGASDIIIKCCMVIIPIIGNYDVPTIMDNYGFPTIMDNYVIPTIMDNWVNSRGFF